LALSFDHSIRSRQHIRRNRQADLLGGFEIDDQLELLRLLDRKIACFAPLRSEATRHAKNSDVPFTFPEPER
jgi:hypothetical protein